MTNDNKNNSTPFYMKQKILFLSLLLTATFGLKAQDTIVMLDGNEVVAKIDKITDTEIEYRIWDNQDGPLRVTVINKIFMVKYANGQHEVFMKSRDLRDDGNGNSKKEDYGLKTDVRLKRNGNMIVSTDEINKEPDNLQELLGEKKYNEYIVAKKNAADANSAVAFGFIAGIGGFAGCIFGARNEKPIYCIIGVALAIFGDVLIPVGLVDGGVNKGRISRIAEDYNEYCGNTISMSVCASPSLLVFNGTLAPGVGLSLRF